MGCKVLVVLETPESVALAYTLSKAGYKVTLYTTLRPSSNTIIKVKQAKLGKKYNQVIQEERAYKNNLQLRLGHTGVKSYHDMQLEEKQAIKDDEYENLAAREEFFSRSKLFRIEDKDFVMKRRRPSKSTNGNGSGNVYFDVRNAGLKLEECDWKKQSKDGKKYDYIFEVKCTIKGIKESSKKGKFLLVYVPIPYSELILDDVYKNLLKHVRSAVGPKAFFVGLHQRKSDRIDDIYADADIGLNRCAFGMENFLSFSLTHQIVVNSVKMGCVKEEFSLAKRRTKESRLREQEKRSKGNDKKGSKNLENTQQETAGEEVSRFLFKSIVDELAKEKLENEAKQKIIKNRQELSSQALARISPDQRGLEPKISNDKKQNNIKGKGEIKRFSIFQMFRKNTILEKSDVELPNPWAKKKFLFSGEERIDLQNLPGEASNPNEESQFLAASHSQAYNIEKSCAQKWTERNRQRINNEQTLRHQNRMANTQMHAGTRAKNLQGIDEVGSLSRLHAEKKAEKRKDQIQGIYYQQRQCRYYAFYIPNTSVWIFPLVPTLMLGSNNRYHLTLDDALKNDYELAISQALQSANENEKNNRIDLYRSKVFAFDTLDFINAIMIPLYTAMKRIGNEGKLSWERDEELLYVAGSAVCEILLLGNLLNRMCACCFWVLFNCGGSVILILQKILFHIYGDLLPVFLSSRYQNGNIGSDDLVIILGEYAKEADKKGFEVPAIKALQQREVDSIKRLDDNDELYYKKYAALKDR